MSKRSFTQNGTGVTTDYQVMAWKPKNNSAVPGYKELTGSQHLWGDQWPPNLSGRSVQEEGGLVKMYYPGPAPKKKKNLIYSFQGGTQEALLLVRTRSVKCI